MTGKPLSPKKIGQDVWGVAKVLRRHRKKAGGFGVSPRSKFGARGRIRHVEVRELVRKTFGLAPQTTLVVRVACIGIIGCILVLRSIADEKR